jgi:hypothetical protein
MFYPDNAVSKHYIHLKNLFIQLRYLSLVFYSLEFVKQYLIYMGYIDLTVSKIRELC